jgi:hypothetical protein
VPSAQPQPRQTRAIKEEEDRSTHKATLKQSKCACACACAWCILELGSSEFSGRRWGWGGRRIAQRAQPASQLSQTTGSFINNSRSGQKPERGARYEAAGGGGFFLRRTQPGPRTRGKKLGLATHSRWGFSTLDRKAETRPSRANRAYDAVRHSPLLLGGCFFFVVLPVRPVAFALPPPNSEPRTTAARSRAITGIMSKSNCRHRKGPKEVWKRKN